MDHLRHVPWVQQISPLLIIHDSHINIPPALCMRRHNIAGLIHCNILMNSYQIQNLEKPTQQFKIQSSISNNNAHENWKPPKNISSKLKIKLRKSTFNSPISRPLSYPFLTHTRVETRTYYMVFSFPLSTLSTIQYLSTKTQIPVVQPSNS